MSFISGAEDGQKAKSRHFEPYLLAADIPELTEIEKINFCRTLPKTLEAILLVGGKRLSDESYIAGLGGQDYQNMPELGIQMATTDRQSIANTAIRIVYGATESMPFRGLSYFLPGLVYIENLQDVGVKPPQLQIIFANNISSRLDHLDLQKASEQAQRLTLVAKSYIKTFFPKLVESVLFLEDTPLERGSAIRNELLHVAAVLRDRLGVDLDDRLKEKGKNNGSVRTYAFYCAAHLLFHDADLERSLEPLTANQPEIIHPDTIISIGGYQEQDFYKLRHALKPYLGPTYGKKTLQFFTKHRVPPYYMAQGGDIALDDVLMGKNVPAETAKAAQYDINYFYRTSFLRGDIHDFLNQQRKRRLI